MKRVLLGSGGHARVIRAAAESAGQPFDAVCERDGVEPGPAAAGLPVLSESELAAVFPAEATLLVNGVAGAHGMAARQAVARRWQARGYRIVGVIDPRAIVVTGSVIDAGAQVLAGAIIQSGATVDEGAIINSGAIVEHDCHVGAYAHVAPGATLCGAVTVGEGALVGAGAVVGPGTMVGAGARVGAGAAVIRDVRAGATVIGVPARDRS